MTFREVTPGGAAFDLSEASDLLERARRLMEPHRPQVAGLGYYLMSVGQDAVGLRAVVRNVRATSRQESLFV